MARLFAAIDVGSYEVGMKIFQFSGKKVMKEIDHIRTRIELGTDTYKDGKISKAGVDELCNILMEFKTIMEGYKVEAYRAYGTSAIRETENTLIVLEQIKLRTGLVISVLSNSEQRFLHYKAVASYADMFNSIMNKGSLLLDIGGGSVQLSLFENDALVTTQNLRLGILRMRDAMSDFSNRSTIYEELLEEFIDNQLYAFKKLYIDNRKIENIVIIDDYISHVLQQIGENDNLVSRDQFEDFVRRVKDMPFEKISKQLNLTEESASLLTPSVAMVERVFSLSGAQRLWAPGVGVADGIAYEYAQENKFIKEVHDFDKDIIACAKEMAYKYHGNKDRNELLERISVRLFEETKKIHKMDKRDLLLIRIASILNDCGKYISLEGAAESGYAIIMATEMLGLSHAERLIVASVVRYNKIKFDYYKIMNRDTHVDKNTYLRIAKLTAVFRIADGICRSYRTKVKGIRTILKDKRLEITVDSEENINLENRFFRRKSAFFEEVFSVEPVLKYKKKISALK
ncbi:MAG: exopolyphosphatase [Lachnospiraceae bacterium]|nr:exopolyphosphatase [Lachnospiraceae bacterium]